MEVRARFAPLPMPSPSAQLDAPQALPPLEVYAGYLQELVLWLREEGHLLSPIDQHHIELWHRAGYPLEVVLRVVKERGQRLKARKNPPRGLPLRSLNKWVVKEGQAAFERGVGRSGLAEPCEMGGGSGSDTEEPGSARSLLEMLQQAVAAAGREAAETSCRCQALHAAHRSLEDLVGSGEGQLFADLLAVGRAYYDRLWAGLPDGEQETLRSEIVAELGEASLRMDPTALEETVAELGRRRLRDRDPLFDPTTYWSV